MIDPDNRHLRSNPRAKSPHLRHSAIMLELRPNCEYCETDLPPDAPARICSFECTFCAACADNDFAGTCPGCGGNLTPRPVRPAAALAKFPASTVRVVKDHLAP
jgi:hypothetical protein